MESQGENRKNHENCRYGRQVGPKRVVFAGEKEEMADPSPSAATVASGQTPSKASSILEKKMAETAGNSYRPGKETSQDNIRGFQNYDLMAR